MSAGDIMIAVCIRDLLGYLSALVCSLVVKAVLVVDSQSTFCRLLGRGI